MLKPFFPYKGADIIYGRGAVQIGGQKFQYKQIEGGGRNFSASLCKTWEVKWCPKGHCFTDNQPVSLGDRFVPSISFSVTCPVNISGTVMGESPDCLLLSGTMVGENWDYVCWMGRY